MTQFEIDLLKTVWPYIWTGILGAGAWFLRSQSARLDKICEAMNAFNDDVQRIEKSMSEDRSETRHRLDRLIGDADARIGKIEAVCELQHGISLARRSTDQRPVNWAHDSNINGDPR